ADRNRSHWSTSKTPSYTKSVSWQHHLVEANTSLITLTDQRVIFLDKGFWGSITQVDLALKDIVSVSVKAGLVLGEITFSTSGQNYSVSNIFKSAITPFNNLLNKARNNYAPSRPLPEPPPQTAATPAAPTAAPAPTAPTAPEFDDLISKLERLAQLKEKGILTEEEFLQQKQRLLNR
ncbi:MAG: PH domain-containing protein, partial [Mixta calida]|nr:PH domain-containing protein [Mixta calida]